MQNALLTLYPILLLIITFYGAKTAGKGLISDSFISLEQAGGIQTFACIAIILHHVTQQITGYGLRPKGPITLLSYIGFCFTAVFFFFSGYGLIVSVETKPDYLRTFLTRRLPSVLIPFWMINILGVILTGIVSSRKLSVSEILSDIFGITLINGNGWFIIEIVLLYLIFFVLFSLIKNRDLASALLCAATIGIIIFCFLRGHDPEGEQTSWFRGEWWYNSTITFAFGVIFARSRDRFRSFCIRHYFVMAALFSVLTAVCIFASVYAQKHLGYYHEPVHSGIRDAILTLLIQSLTCIITTTFMLILNMKIAIGNKALNIISSMSLELFLIHGFFVSLVFGGREMSDFVRYAAVILSSVIATALVVPAIRFVGKEVSVLLNTKRIRNDTLERQIYEKKKKKKLKILGITGVILALAAVFYLTAGRAIVHKNEYASERKQLEDAALGDKILWGHFDMETGLPGKERVSWIVIDKDAGSALLISEKGLAGSYYHQKHAKVSWSDCDLKREINSGKFAGIFSRYELQDMIPIDGDMISLLTVREADSFFAKDEERELMITPVAKAQGTNINDMSKHNYWDYSSNKTSWWWLRPDDDIASLTAPIVTVDGIISEDEKYVNKPGGAIRPVIRVGIK